MEYEVGQRVKIKSLDWYNRYTNGTEVNCKHYPFSCHMKKYCGQIMTISVVGGHSYSMIEDDGAYSWTDEMIEGLAEEENNHLTETIVDAVRESNDRYRIVLDPRFDIEVDEGEYYAVRRKKEYPKTYEECCEVLGVDSDNFLSIRNLYRDDGDEESTDYERDLLGKFNSLWELKICRDSYWKIAGEEMGLGKPWKPDWNNISDKYCIYFISGNAWSKECQTRQCPLAFPTPEMRDAFKENFDPDIEICKEFL